MPEERNTEIRPIYFGPPIGFYEPHRFNQFVRLRVVDALGPFACEYVAEGEMPHDRTFRFPHAHMEVRYEKDDTRCRVNLHGARQGLRHLDKVKELFFGCDSHTA